MRKNSIKNTRINGEVQRVLADIIRGEIKDPRINPLTSVVAVEVAPDLNAVLYLMALIRCRNSISWKRISWLKFQGKNMKRTSKAV